jgi:single-strand DNA-binding protein
MLNRAELIGNLGADPEVRYTPAGQPVANFRVATNRFWTDKKGEKQQSTEWHRIVVWGKLAELCGQYLTKGRQVYLSGRLQTRQWDGRDGEKKYTTEIVADQVTFLGGARKDGESGGGESEGGDYGPPPSDMDVPL